MFSLAAYAVCGCIFLSATTWSTELSEDEYGEVVYVTILFRHGDRTPVAPPYPLDPHKNYTWPRGYGELTDKGMLQTYQLGQYMRKKYNRLAKEDYDSKTINVTSSDCHRTMMSAYCFLFGLFPRNAPENWNSNTTWQPIPVHTIPRQIDNIMAAQAACQRYMEERNKLGSLSEFKTWMKTYDTTFRKLQKFTGYDFTNGSAFQRFQKAALLYDTLFIEENHNLSLPEWTKELYPEPLRKMVLLHFKSVIYTPQMQRISAGPILKRITGDMQDKIKRNSTKTMEIYSGHDGTVTGILSAFGCFNNILVPYAASVSFELRKWQGEYYVTVMYKNSSESSYLMKIKNCDTKCPFDEFVKIAKETIPDNWLQECRMEPRVEAREASVNPNNVGVVKITVIAVVSFMAGGVLYHFISILFLKNS